MENTTERWLVVNFIEEDSVEIVPRKWFVASVSKCFWPDEKYSGKITEAIKKSCSPGPWKLHSVRVLGEYDNFKVAEKKVHKAKVTDNLTSNSEREHLGKRRRCPKKRIYESSTSESSSDESGPTDYPPPPPAKKLFNKKEICQTRIADIEEPACSRPTEMNMRAHTNKADVIHTSEVNKPAAIVELCTPSTSSYTPQTAIEVSAFNTPKSSQSLLFHTKEYSNEFERRVLRELYLINAKLNEHSENFAVLLKCSGNNTSVPFNGGTENLETLKHFPIKNEEQLLLVEGILQDNEQFNQTAKYLSMVGGSEAKTITIKILYRILSNDVGRLFTWEGTKNKKAFKTLAISGLIIRAVRLNSLTKDATESTIIGAIKIWLVKAKERHFKHLMKLQDQAANDQENMD